MFLFYDINTLVIYIIREIMDKQRRYSYSSIIRALEYSSREFLLLQNNKITVENGGYASNNFCSFVSVVSTGNARGVYKQLHILASPCQISV